MVEDETAPLLWARFYEIGTNRLIYADADGAIVESLADLSYERRVGYRWLTDRPALLVDEEFPAWKQDRQQAATARTLRYTVLAVLICLVLGITA